MRSTGVVLVMLLVASFPAFAQGGAPGQTAPPGQPGTLPPPPNPNNPQRMPARPTRPGELPPKGTAVIKGQVTSSGTGTAVRRAQVRAMSMEGRGGGVTSTDNNGLFEIKDLPAGRYTVTAMKGGFAQASFGARRPGDPGTPIDLADGQTADKVSFVLSRGGVISGVIVDDGGEPVAGTQVAAMRYQWMSGSRRLVPAFSDGSNDRTDDRGGFRLYGLPPGEYFLQAANRNNSFVGPGMSNTEAEAFAPTFYPGTSNIAEATRIMVKGGQEVGGANFALIVARMARIRGRALTSRGEPAAGMMAMLAPSDPFGGPMMMNMSNSVIGADGNFEFANVAPGRYNINLRPSGGMQNPNAEFAVMPLTVSNDDIDNVIITTHVGATVRGIVITDDGQPPPFRADQVQVFAQTMEPTAMFVQPGQNRMQDDYSFEMTGLFDRRRFSASVGPQGLGSTWFLKSVIYDGQDVTDSGIEFTPGRAYDGVQITFTQKTTDLSGAVTDERGKPVLDATVVVFPANRERWAYLSRYIRTARPDTNGRFSIKNMPPGEDYLIIAVQNLESGQGTDPEFLARAREEARSFSLAEAETKVVDLRLSPLVP
jgi:hypothetical protein